MARVAGLDQARIVAASLRLADAAGLESVTMRRLSAELGVTPMAIYHHVSGKEELLDLVVDESLREVGEIDDDADAAASLARLFSALYELLVAHPSLAEAVARRRLEGPVAARIAAGVIRLAKREGLDDEDAVELLFSLFSYTLGSSLYRISRSAAGARDGDRRLVGLGDTGSPGAEWLRERLAGAEIGDQQFRSGLRRLVDGYLSHA